MFQKYVLENISVALHSHFTIHKLHFLASTEYRDMLQTAVQSCEHGHHGSWQVISPNWVLHTFLNLFYKYAYSWIHEHMHACTCTHAHAHTELEGEGLNIMYNKWGPVQHKLNSWLLNLRENQSPQVFNTIFVATEICIS